MGRSLVALAGALTLLSLGTTGAVMWNDSVDPDAPVLPTFGKCGTIVDGRGPTTTDAKIRRFDIGGIHLGMSAADALKRLRSISQSVQTHPYKYFATPSQVVGKTAWTEFAIGSEPEAGSLSQLALGPTNIRLGTTIWPDGAERITSIEYNALTPDSDHTLASSPNFDFTTTVIREVAGKLGRPTIHARHSCSNEPFVAWGDDINLDRFYSVEAYSVCKSTGGGSTDPNFQCDRRRSIKSPYVILNAGPRDFYLRIIDGERSYTSRYSRGYQKSYVHQTR